MTHERDRRPRRQISLLSLLFPLLSRKPFSRYHAISDLFEWEHMRMAPADTSIRCAFRTRVNSRVILTSPRAVDALVADLSTRSLRDLSRITWDRFWPLTFLAYLLLSRCRCRRCGWERASCGSPKAEGTAIADVTSGGRIARRRDVHARPIAAWQRGRQQRSHCSPLRFRIAPTRAFDFEPAARRRIALARRRMSRREAGHCSGTRCGNDSRELGPNGRCDATRRKCVYAQDSSRRDAGQLALDYCCHGPAVIAPHCA